MDQELFKFRAITGHQDPLKATDPDLKISRYNVQVEWETGQVTFELLSVIAADGPVTCAAYTMEHDNTEEYTHKQSAKSWDFTPPAINKRTDRGPVG